MSEINYLEEISSFIFTSKYSRYIDELNRRETWEEAVDRLQGMHLKKYSFLNKEDKNKIKWAFELVKQKRIVPSMRSLQFGGKAIESHQARIFNCCVRHIDSLRSFAEMFYLLLCGTGTVIGLNKTFLARFPDLVSAEDKTGTVLSYTVEDSIEGWADSVEALLGCYFRNTPYTGRKIVFDYSKIRKKGERLKTGGGKAPGYKGLKGAHTKIKELLDDIIENKNRVRLKSIDAYDILMHCADAVLSGGIRRSATCVVFEKDDEDMINSKTMQEIDKSFSFHHVDDETSGGHTTKIYEGKIIVNGVKHEIVVKEWELDNIKKGFVNWWHLYPQRGRSNNSVLLLRDEITIEEFKAIVERTKQFGEPGFVFADHPHTLFNPCFEISFIPVTDDGVCGVQFCNLCSMNGRLVDTVEKFKENVEAYAIIGTLQAGYTTFPYLNKASEKLTQEEALLGLSITGMMDNPDVLLNPENQREMAKFSIEVNKEWAAKLHINQAARITCLKPEGTSSLVLGTGSGIHPHHARKYFRRVINNKIDNIYKFFKKHNPHMCEASVWSANKTDDVITFPIEVNASAKVKGDFSAIEHLEIIKSTQENWVIAGTTVANKKPINHNVSCTVVVKPEEWEGVVNFLFENRKYFTAVSLLSASGDKDYCQAPMEAVITEEDQKKWDEIVFKMKHVDYTELKEDDDKTSLQAEFSCAGGQCELNI